MKDNDFNYQEGGTRFKGYYAYDENITGKLPVVMVFHSFEGCNELAREYARKFAELGYVGCAPDMYGDGKVATDLDGCMAMLKPLFQDRAELRKRLQAAYAAVCKLDVVDHHKIAAIGFCFGGLCSLDLARSGADVKGVVPIHGVWAAPDSIPNEKITAKVLALHGYDDPQVPPDQLSTLAKEMNDAGIDWQVHFFSHTQHAFTDPDANKIGPPDMGRVYNPIATQRSWEMIVSFMWEILR